VATSPAHVLGEIIGTVFETMVDDVLQGVATDHKLYLDRHGVRGCRSGVKCSWLDKYDNSHDLDFVLERGGSDDRLGRPVAFVEAAWRRYTKHSRNKVQEIQGSVGPVAERYNEQAPFLGAILAGHFTVAALAQLRSHGFQVLLIPYSSIIQAFASAKVDVDFQENTEIDKLQRKVDAWKGRTVLQRSRIVRRVASELRALNRAEIGGFVGALESALNRTVDRVTILPLSGNAVEYSSIADAIEFITHHEPKCGVQSTFVRYEVQVWYSNGDRIQGQFGDRDGAVGFLRLVAGNTATHAT
jgi:hypothetical protein